MGVVSAKEVSDVAFLARLQLEEAELARLSAQLDDILKYVQQLQAVSTDGVEPTSHVLPLANVTRADQIKLSVNPEQALAIAPARHGQLFKVPKILE
jgi:aspartyl-tRNA(Asn)/glutamyl-tRNA(Gln) amidotransferase subunit C